MRNFTFYAPTKVVFGRDTESQAGSLVKEFGGSRVQIISGGKSSRESGLIGRITAALDEAGIPYCELTGVEPNPRLSLVRKGIEQAKEFQADFLLSVGGGSAADTAKAIAYGLAYDGDVWDFFGNGGVPQDCYPLGVVLTIAAAGSEMSNSCVITNDEIGLKRGCNSNISRPRFAIMNPELTYTLPPYQTACGIVDILMHTLERYFTTETGNTLSDSLAEGLMRTVLECGSVAMKEPNNYEARANLMWASSLSHNDLTGCGGVGDWACHQLGHELSAQFDCAHGASLSAVWPSWARYVLSVYPERFANWAIKVMGVEAQATLEETAEAGISALVDYFHSINMPANLPELGYEINDTIIDDLALKCSFFHKRTIGRFRTLDIEDIKAIYHQANKA